MTQYEKEYIYESFKTKEGMEKAFQAALDLGYKPEEINVIMSEETRTRLYPHQTAEREAAQGLAVGGILGGTLGGTIGALIALGTNLALPGIGLVIAGPLVGAGGVYGGLLGSFLGWSSPNEEELPNANDLPNPYIEPLREGAIILVMANDPEKPAIKEIWSGIRNQA